MEELADMLHPKMQETWSKITYLRPIRPLTPLTPLHF